MGWALSLVAEMDQILPAVYVWGRTYIARVCLCVCVWGCWGVLYTWIFAMGIPDKLSINITHCSLQDVHNHIQIAICVYLHLHLHSYIYIYNIQVNEYMYTYVCTCMSIHKHASDSRVHTCIYVYIYIDIYAHVGCYTLACICTYRHAHLGF